MVQLFHKQYHTHTVIPVYAFKSKLLQDRWIVSSAIYKVSSIVNHVFVGLCLCQIYCTVAYFIFPLLQWKFLKVDIL